MPHICVSESGQHWLRWLFVAHSAPSHFLKQCCMIANGTLRNKLQWNFDQNTKHLLCENTSGNIVYEMATILSRERCVNRVTNMYLICQYGLVSLHTCCVYKYIVVWCTINMAVTKCAVPEVPCKSMSQCPKHSSFSNSYYSYDLPTSITAFL